MRTKLYVLSVTVLMVLLSLSCNKAKENIDILINADIIHYSVLFDVREATTGNVPEGLSVSAIGQDAGVVYDISGNKNLSMDGGLLTLGIDPHYDPQGGNPLKFSLKITGEGYATMIVPVTINEEQFHQVKNVKLLKLSNPPASVTVVNTNEALATNSTPAQPIVVSSPATTDVPEIVTVTVPAGTKFLDNSGTQINGNLLNLSVVNYNAQNSDNNDLFPGGTFAAEDVNGPNGQTISTYFTTAAVAKVTFTINGQEVKKFDQPISLLLEVNPSYKMAGTNDAVKVGDKLSIWSYSEDTGKWSYEKEGTVTLVNGKFVVEFTTNHLTYYSLNEYVETTSCSSPNLVFNASWLNVNTQPMVLQIWNSDGSKLLETNTVIVSNGLEYALNNLPSYAVSYKVLTTSGEQLAVGTIANPCSGGRLNVQVAAPAVPVVGVTLSLTVKCPNKGIVTPPDFYLYYKTAGAADATYKLLGVVKKGKLTTTLLQLGQRYDFKAQWGDHVKIIKNYLIDKNNLSTTVGLDDHIGDISPEKNRAILIEECSKI
ncbi:hypothetical protein FW774_18505 [Pedobacter sp. BS3]|uniref:hypothetical protein n=1 Tax=Pedobacter sp. BS3 TaxID=2567937 RepID=UPI0011EFDE01|nr:hypothetical protein [Pedobacter sp. BS3]TZF81541.1 hypothetical protein FW774_18505 [Pedobacter sp. BS3]